MATPSPAASPQKQKLYEQIVDAFQSIFGKHPGYRPAHAKGIVCEGIFTPDPAAASLSRALHFQGGTAPVTLRFSDATGIPSIPDADPNASPRGLGIKFHLPDGTASDIVAHSYNGFPVGTAEEFLGFVQALAASGPSVPKPTPIEIFLGGHPRALAFATGQKPAPVSFMTESYFGVNAFRFINRQGASQYARYQIRPAGGEAHLTAGEAAKRSQNFLFDELRERLSKGAAELTLVAQIAGPGDRTDDGSINWPDDRRNLELGTMRVIKPVEDSEAVQRKLIFDPTRLTDGIELSDDPLLTARAAIYSISYERRNP